MSEEIRELTAEEKAAKEALDRKLAECTTEEGAYNVIMREMGLEKDSEELNEDALDLVVGGSMSIATALKVVSTSYWDLCIAKKGTTPYSMKQINEAFDILERANDKVLKTTTGILLKYALATIGL